MCDVSASWASSGKLDIADHRKEAWDPPFLRAAGRKDHRFSHCPVLLSAQVHTSGFCRQNDGHVPRGCEWQLWILFVVLVGVLLLNIFQLHWERILHLILPSFQGALGPSEKCTQKMQYLSCLAHDRRRARVLWGTVLESLSSISAITQLVTGSLCFGPFTSSEIATPAQWHRSALRMS